MPNIKSMVQFWAENGLYTFLQHLARVPSRTLRNHMLASRLGVRSIVIGPDSMLRGLCAVRMGEGFSAERGLWLEAVLRHNGATFNPNIIIGNNVRISTWGHIAATNSVQIGDNVLIGSKVMITDHNHGQYSGTGTCPTIPPNIRPLSSDKEVLIERNVWIGDGVVITPGTTIGEGSVIGANAVVVGTIPPFTIAGGIPAKPLKQYNFNQSQWVSII